MVELTKEQSFQVSLLNAKRQYIRFKNKFSCKVRIPCLGCGKDIFVSYDYDTIFCPECYNKHRFNKTIVQENYKIYLNKRKLESIQLSLNGDNKLHNKDEYNLIPEDVRESIYIKTNRMPKSATKIENAQDMDSIIKKRKFDEIYNSSELESMLEDF